MQITAIIFIFLVVLISFTANSKYTASRFRHLAANIVYTLNAQYTKICNLENNCYVIIK